MPLFRLPIEWGRPVSSQLHCDASILAAVHSSKNRENFRRTRSKTANLAREQAGESSGSTGGSGSADMPGSGGAGGSATGEGEEAGGEDEGPEDDPPEDRDELDRSDEPAEGDEEDVKTDLRVIFLIKTDHPDQDFLQGNSYYLAIPYRAAHEPICPRPWTRQLDEVSDQSVKKKLIEDEEGVQGDAGHAMHQSLATALHVKELSQQGKVEFEVEIRAYKNEILDELAREHRSAPDGQQQETILVIMYTGTPDVESTPAPWKALPRGKLPGLRLYPCETEMMSENGKIGDMVALDAVAAKGGHWRPQTCFGVHHVFNNGIPRCPLIGSGRTVYKRTWSDANLHVGIKHTRESPLTCMPLPEARTRARPQVPARASASARAPAQGRRRPSRQVAASSGDDGLDYDGDDDDDDDGDDGDDGGDGAPAKKLKFTVEDHIVPRGARLQTRWFHQELVPSLQHGEFRVFVATKPDPDGLRGRRGYVVHWIVTATRRDNRECGDNMLVTRPDLGGSSSDDPAGPGGELAGMDGKDPFAARGTTHGAVVTFALEVFEALRHKGGAAFDSLEVGCRVDVGVRAPRSLPGGEGEGEGEDEAKLFVNEINRWYSATYFSIESLPSPHTKICAHFALAFANWIRSGGHKRDLDEGPSAIEG
ncbi:hypothetical protein RB601_003868 [Gaeumannomyces tritici]